MRIRRLILTLLAALVAAAPAGAAYGAQPPGARVESVADVAATSATLKARIDPEGAPAFYYFQYGTSTAYGADAPALSVAAPHGVALGAGTEYQEVGVHIQGLQAAATYHYRVVVVAEPVPGEFETFPGPDRTFSTQSTGAAAALPDGRAWEMVTPPNKQGAGQRHRAATNWRRRHPGRRRRRRFHLRRDRPVRRKPRRQPLL